MPLHCRYIAVTLLSKVKMIQFATEAAITVLRIDDMIKLAPEEQQQQ